MTLCGVLKDILLVAASIAIWGTPVSLTQYFGYSIALAGMIYYKLGAESIKTFFSDAQRQWSEYGAKSPAQRKMVIFAMVLVTLFLLLGGLAPASTYDVAANAAKSGQDYVGGLMGSKSTTGE